MSYPDGVNDAVDLLVQVRAAVDISLDALSENERLKSELKVMQEKYDSLLMSSIRASEETSAGILRMMVMEGKRRG